KKKITLLLVAFLTFSNIAAAVDFYPVKVSAEENEVVETSVDSWMPDSHLQEAVAKAYKSENHLPNFDKNQLTKEIVATVKSISYVPLSGAPDEEKIHSIAGLEYATNLQSIIVTNNSISDLSPLSNLKKLNGLELSSNNIYTIDFLSNSSEKWPRLNYLYLGNNHITDLSPLLNVKHLVRVAAENQTIYLDDLQINQPTLSTPNIVKSYSNNFVPISIKSTGNEKGILSEDFATITLSNFSDQSGEFTYSWNVPSVDATFAGSTNDIFSGKIIQPFTIEHISVAYVTVHYQDTNGNKLIDDKVLFGNIGNVYQSEQLDFNGYTFKEVLGDTSGKFTDVAQEVTYIYSENPIKAANVTVHYQDIDGNKLTDDKILSGNIGDDYQSEELDFNGYTFKEVLGDTSGKFTDVAQEVTYVYELSDGAAVTLKYVDEDGKSIAKEAILTGKLGSNYEAKAKQIEGYTLKETPENASGTFTEKEQVVTFEYERNMSNQPSVPPTNTDKENPNSSKPINNKDTSILPQTGEHQSVPYLMAIGILLLGSSAIFLRRCKKV
ncbi:LPXTG cell wall anchor domain-containing protein, partial [Listeria monocytogenes]|nr:LPXTG cell wall anchor domain-containing protein [Listeria monocytogenes]EAH2848647.1 LPXTG cell wall anchor domain-containing protein [Listeria monocytogenes]